MTDTAETDTAERETPSSPDGAIARERAAAAERRDADLSEVAAAMALLAKRAPAPDALTQVADSGPVAEKPAANPQIQDPREVPVADIAEPMPALAVERSLAVTPAAPSSPDGAPAVDIGILLVNLGTPDAADTASVRRYLREFLTDPRVIEKDSWLWRFILNNIILRFRPRISARNYRKIWNNERNESPLRTITRAQAETLATLAAPLGEHVFVDWAMRYGTPSISAGLSNLAKKGCDRVLLVPLYPQYAAATTATVCDESFRALMRMRWQPTLRVAPPYFDDKAYIEALATSIETHLRSLDFTPDVILASFHGIPKEYVDKGDPYARQCGRTIALLRERLGMDETKLLLTFQSRFGRAQWLQPYTDQTVKRLAKGGVKNIVVVTPGFSADCLETLEEIAGENGDLFEKHGGENFSAVPCLNDSDVGMAMIWSLVLRELKGWV